MAGNYSMWIALVLFLLAFAAFIVIIVRIQRDPKNANKEIGRTLLEMGVTYNLSALLLIQAMAGICEAGIIGSLADANMNVGARMFAHMVVWAASFVAALTWIKSIREFFQVLVSGYHWGKILALCCICLIIAAIAFTASIGAPIINMMAVANAAHNTTQLDLFWKSVFSSDVVYLSELAKMGLPITYSPWGGLSGPMLTSVILTSFHIMVSVWEVFLILKLSLTKADMATAFNTDIFEDKVKGNGKGNGKGKGKGSPPPADDDENDDQGEDEDEDKGKGKGKKQKSSYATEVLSLWEMDESTQTRWATKLDELLSKPNDDDGNVKFALEIAKVHKEVMTFKSKGKGTGGQDKAAIAAEVRKIVKARSGGKLTLPDIKEKK